MQIAEKKSQYLLKAEDLGSYSKLGKFVEQDHIRKFQTMRTSPERKVKVRPST